MSGRHDSTSDSGAIPMAEAFYRSVRADNPGAYACWVNTASLGAESWAKAVAHPPRDEGPSPVVKWVVGLAPLSIFFWGAVGCAVWWLFQ